MKIKLAVLLGVLALSITACGVKSKYDWGNYENALYQHYKNPADQEQLAESLADIIAYGETTGTVPPGIYAEYGYLLYTAGKNQDAIAYFEKEKKAWPESGRLMDKMIENAKGGPVKKTPPKSADKKSAGGPPK